MLEKGIADSLKKEIKKINKEKNINNRIEMMCNLKDKLRADFNNFLDDVFSEVNLQIKKYDFVDDLEEN